MINNFAKKGITITELLVVLAVIGIIAILIIPQLSKMRENQILKTSVADTLSSLNKARSQTLSSLDSSEYGVHFQSDAVIIFKGTTYSAGDTDNEAVSIVTPASISNVTLDGVSGTSGDIYFERLTSIPSKIGTITISTSSYSKIITIYATGVSSMN
jgi:prepilin-type N-terminal cleavage/methylation domain-containing protein